MKFKHTHGGFDLVCARSSVLLHWPQDGAGMLEEGMSGCNSNFKMSAWVQSLKRLHVHVRMTQMMHYLQVLATHGAIFVAVRACVRACARFERLCKARNVCVCM